MSFKKGDITVVIEDAETSGVIYGLYYATNTSGKCDVTIQNCQTTSYATYYGMEGGKINGTVAVNMSGNKGYMVLWHAADHCKKNRRCGSGACMQHNIK